MELLNFIQVKKVWKFSMMGKFSILHHRVKVPALVQINPTVSKAMKIPYSRYSGLQVYRWVNASLV